MRWTSRDRVLAALRRQQPDRVPYCELAVDRALAERMLGWPPNRKPPGDRETNDYNVEEAKAVADRLAMDNISYVLRAPVYADKVRGIGGRLFYGDGTIRSWEDLERLVLPDPYDDSLYAEAAEFAANKGDYAAFFVTRIGIFPTWLSMGMDAFSVALHDDRALVERILDIYCEWLYVVAEKVCQLDFDVFVSTDDMAYNSAPFFSPHIFHDMVMPRYREAAQAITKPWIIHSDGNIEPFLADLMQLGIAGLHPIEKAALDIRAVKRKYGDRLCILGNVDLVLLGMGSPAEVDEEVRGLIRDVGAGGGYIVTSGNSLAAYCDPDNVLALASAVQRYGRYPLDL